MTNQISSSSSSTISNAFRWDHLPEDLRTHIARFMDDRTKVSLSLANHSCKQIVINSNYQGQSFTVSQIQIALRSSTISVLLEKANNLHERILHPLGNILADSFHTKKEVQALKWEFVELINYIKKYYRNFSLEALPLDPVFKQEINELTQLDAIFSNILTQKPTNVSEIPGIFETLLQKFIDPERICYYHNKIDENQDVGQALNNAYASDEEFKKRLFSIYSQLIKYPLSETSIIYIILRHPETTNQLLINLLLDGFSIEKIYQITKNQPFIKIAYKTPTLAPFIAKLLQSNHIEEALKFISQVQFGSEDFKQTYLCKALPRSVSFEKFLEIFKFDERLLFSPFEAIQNVVVPEFLTKAEPKKLLAFIHQIQHVYGKDFFSPFRLKPNESYPLNLTPALLQLAENYRKLVECNDFAKAENLLNAYCTRGSLEESEVLHRAAEKLSWNGQFPIAFAVARRIVNQPIKTTVYKNLCSLWIEKNPELPPQALRELIQREIPEIPYIQNQIFDYCFKKPL